MATHRRPHGLLTPTHAAASLLLAATLTFSCKDKPAENTVDAAASTPPVTSTATPMASSPTPVASASASSGAGDHEGKRGGPHGGPSAMLFQAARELDLKPEQKTKIEAAEKTAHAGAGEASRDAMKTASKDLHTDLVAGIKAGKIDTAKLEPRYAAIEKVVAEAQAKEAEALTTLHDTLDATQRKAVTAGVRAKQAAREAKMMDHRDGGGPDGGKPAAMAKRNIERLTHGLELDADQQKKVDALVAKEDAKPRPDATAMKKNVDALLVAFEKDTFDAKKLDAFDAKKARGAMDQETTLLAQLVPILKPEQREKLADKMDKGPSPHGRRAGAGHRPLEEQDEDE